MSTLLILFWTIYNNFLVPSFINNLKKIFDVCSFYIWMRIMTLFLFETKYLHPWLSLVSNCPKIRVIPDPPRPSFLPSVMERRHSAVKTQALGLKLLSLRKRRRWSRERAVLSHSVVSDSLQPHRLCSPPGPSVHGIFRARILELGKDTGVGTHSLLQGIFPTQGWNPVSWVASRFLPSEPLGKPYNKSNLLFMWNS